MADLVDLARDHPARYGVPVVSVVDRSIFTKRYYTHCLACSFCADRCCSYGVDVDLLHRDRMLAHAEVLEAYTGVARDEWFRDDVIEDSEMPGGGVIRTNVRHGACVFLERDRRGCSIHRYCAEFGLDYHELKGIVDCLYPLTVIDGVLGPADEVDDGTLVCLGKGPTLYRGLHDELRFYFGEPLLAELDRLEAEST